MPDDERQPLLREPEARAPDIPAAEILTEPPLAIRVAAVAFNFAITGIWSGAIGALIPEIEEYYKIRNGPAAFIFPAQLFGYLTSVAVIQRVHNRFGRRGIATLGPLFRLAGASLLLTGPRYFLTLIGFFAFGTGTGFTDAGFCAWGGSLKYANVVQGVMHGSWSTGCVFGPLVVALLIRRGGHWFNFYAFVAILCCLEGVALTSAFWRDDAVRYHQKMSPDTKTSAYSALRSKLTWMCGLFWFVYVGMESSYGDWIVTYFEHVRNIDRAAAASASSLFWVGMAVGRVVLSGFTEHSGIKTSVAAYIVLSTIFQATFKFLANGTTLLANLAVVGFFFGPFFPSGVILLAQKLPLEMHVGAISAASAMGQIGGATAPLIVGFMADAFGVARLLDTVIVLSLLLLMVWLAFCRLR